MRAVLETVVDRFDAGQVMPLQHKEFGALHEDDLQALIENRVSEGKRIEYKENQPAVKDNEKKKFLRQVSSFANALGGHIVYGIKERGGVPIKIVGYDIDDTDEEVQRLSNIIRDGVEPRIHGVDVRGVPLGTGKQAVVVRIPRSFNPPHMVVLGGERRFYSRGPAGIYPLDVGELRTLFGLADTTAKRSREFRAERLMRIKSGETPVPVLKGPKCVLHIVPLDSFTLGTTHDLSRFDKDPTTLPNIKWRVHTGRYNFDGFVSHHGHISPQAPKPICSYTQVFRNGIIEAVYMDYNPNVEGEVEKSISLDYEDDVIHSVKELLDIQRQMDISPPVSVMVTFLNVKGRSFTGKRERYGTLITCMPFEQDDLALPEIVVEDFDSDVSANMRVIFDIVLNAVALKRDDVE